MTTSVISYIIILNKCCLEVIKIKTVLKALAVVSGLFAILFAIHITGVYQIFRTENMTDTDIKQSSYMQYTVTQDKVKVLGRSEYIDSVRYFSMSGSGVEFICKGQYAEITVVGDNAQSTHSNHLSRIGIYLNGELIFDELVDYQEKTYKVEINDYVDGGVIRVIKLSEPMFSSFGISKITSFSKKEIKPTKPSELKIEFIGDSITCGYGLDEENPYGSFSTTTENFSKTYAYLTAKSFNADYSTVSFSGYGVYTGFSRSYRNSEYTIEKEYNKSVLLSDRVERLWDFNSFIPNLVVINLGTNDAAYCSRSYQRREEFQQAYVELLRNIRGNYPDAYILCVLGDMNDSMFSEIEDAVAQFKTETVDNRVSARQIGFRMDEYPAVIDGHPNDMSNISASSDLYMIIQELINYGELPSAKG